ncbi:MAG: hypothetical protein IPL52_10375 [Flavobacteriales bacterium]|nr:hypothetical protein [Flavobacteriales bacterium]
MQFRRGVYGSCNDKLTADNTPNNTSGNVYQFWFLRSQRNAQPGVSIGERRHQQPGQHGQPAHLVEGRSTMCVYALASAQGYGARGALPAA